MLVLDCAAEVGVGHAIRCQALAEELIARGWQVVHVGRMEIAWVRRSYEELGVTLLGPVPPLVAARSHDPAVVVLDSYTAPVELSASLCRSGTTVLAVVDDTTRGQQAHAYLEQNLGSSAATLGVTPPAQALCGPQHALLRNLVLARRTAPWQPRGRGPLRVAAVFGGTDPAHGAVVAARLLARTEAELDVTVVAATPAHAAELATVPWRPGQRASVIPSRPEFIASLADADVVVSAAGSTVYEVMALGRPVILCPVAANQQQNYRRLVRRELAVGLGALEHARDEPAAAAAALAAALADHERLRRQAAAGFDLVDGLGRVRVLSSLGLIPSPA